MFPVPILGPISVRLTGTTHYFLGKKVLFYTKFVILTL